MFTTVRPGCSWINPVKVKKTTVFKSGITQIEMEDPGAGKMTEMYTTLCESEKN